MFNFSRRINGRTYYVGYLLGLVAAIMDAILLAITENVQSRFVELASGVAIIVVALVVLVYWICLTRQRANDIGWHPLLLTLVAWSFTPITIIFGLIPGQKTENRYGHTPKPTVELT